MHTKGMARIRKTTDRLTRHRHAQAPNIHRGDYIELSKRAQFFL